MNKELPEPPLMRLACGVGKPCPLCGSGQKIKGLFGNLFGVYKGCYQPGCENYWRK